MKNKFVDEAPYHPGYEDAGFANKQTTTKMSVLKEAEKIIYGDREKTYGKPSKNLDTIAKMWNAYLNAYSALSVEDVSTGEKQAELTAKDVAVMMVLLKAARLANDPSHRDSLVDICGYAALVERCDE